MNSEALLYIMTAFVILAALSMLTQAIVTYRAAKLMEEKMATFAPKAERLMETAELAISESRAQIREITQRANQIMDLAKTQLVKVDSLITDASQRARSQMDKAEVVLDDTLDRVQTTVSTVQSGVLRPIREIHGVAAGLRAAFTTLLKGVPADVTRVTSDEEMFI
jgi:ABC-type transporter Mla subunit MlaD